MTRAMKSTRRPVTNFSTMPLTSLRTHFIMRRDVLKDTNIEIKHLQKQLQQLEKRAKREAERLGTVEIWMSIRGLKTK